MVGKKYIINFEDNPGIAPNKEKYYKCCENPWWVAAECTLSKLTPYTEPDLEQIRKEAYDKGYDDATAEIGSDEQAIAEKAYQKGLSDGKNQDAKDFADMYDSGYREGLRDAWDAARKIWEYDTTTLRAIFGEGIMRMDWFMKFTASEAIEKIRRYEQEKEEQDGLRKSIKIFANICGYSLEEIAEALQKMKEE